MLYFSHFQVRGYACDCSYPSCCDSQAAPLPPTRLALAQQQGQGQDGDPADGRQASHPAPKSIDMIIERNGHEDGDEDGGSGSGSGSVTISTSGSSSGSGLPAKAASNSDAHFKKLEQEHVVQVYDAIAQHFSATR